MWTLLLALAVVAGMFLGHNREEPEVGMGSAGQDSQGLQKHECVVEHVLDELLVQPVQLRISIWDHSRWLELAVLLSRVP